MGHSYMGASPPCFRSDYIPALPNLCRHLCPHGPMNKWETLKQLCPRLYRHGMYFECASGWYDILTELSLKIERILEQHGDTRLVCEGEEDIYIEMFAVQVKEKYGTLRFYMSCENEDIARLIQEAEIVSYKTCEICGSPGTMRNNGWVTVRCENCFLTGV